MFPLPVPLTLGDAPMRRKRHAAMFASAAILASLVVVAGPAPQASAVDPTFPTRDFLAKRAGQYLEQRARAVTVGGAQVAATSTVPATAAMTQRLNAEYRQLAELGFKYQEIDGGYSRAEVTITPNPDGPAGSVDGKTALFGFTEDTKLYHVLTAEEIAEGAPEAEEYSLDHMLRFTRGTDGIWRLADDNHEVGSMPPSTYMAEPELDLEIPEEDSGAPDAPEGDKVERSDPVVTTGGDPKEFQAMAGYDYKQMAAYANKHWKNYNKNWREYDNDCTNFISQAMSAGGWKMTSGGFLSRKDNKKWFYGSMKSTTSYTWAGAENWYWFAQKHSKRTRHIRNVGDMGLGDVLQADFDRNGNINHTMIVTKRANSNSYLSYHTPSVHNRSLKKILAKYPKAWWYAHRT
jgi:hypothetical protein